MTIDANVQLPPSLPVPLSLVASPDNLKCTIYIPSQNGPLSEPVETSLVTFIEIAFRRYCDVPGGLRIFPADCPRLPGGISELYQDLGKGWLFVWTLDDKIVGTATICPLGRGWTRVPIYEEVHSKPAPSLDVPLHLANSALTERAKALISQLENGAGVALYQLSVVAVDPRLQRTGVGSAILRYVEEFVRAVDVSEGNFWVGGGERVGGTEKKMVIAFTVGGKAGNDTWYGKRGYELVATAHKGYGFWGCHLEEGFDLLTILKEL